MLDEIAGGEVVDTKEKSGGKHSCPAWLHLVDTRRKRDICTARPVIPAKGGWGSGCYRNSFLQVVEPHRRPISPKGTGILDLSAGRSVAPQSQRLTTRHNTRCNTAVDPSMAFRNELELAFTAHVILGKGAVSSWNRHHLPAPPTAATPPRLLV